VDAFSARLQWHSVEKGQKDSTCIAIYFNPPRERRPLVCQTWNNKFGTWYDGPEKQGNTCSKSRDIAITMQGGARLKRGEWNEVEFRVQLTCDAGVKMTLTSKNSQGTGKTEAEFKFDDRAGKRYYINQLAGAFYYGRGGHPNSEAYRLSTGQCASQFFKIEKMCITVNA
jgi:hypothetical protein